MTIFSKERLATATLLTVIGLIALAVWATYVEVEKANQERVEALDLARALVNLRLVTFEYSLTRGERPRAQWHGISKRIDGMLDGKPAADEREREIVADMSLVRTQAKRLFHEYELSAEAGGPETEIDGRFRAQTLTRLYILHQDNITAAFRLKELSAERGERAQKRLFVATLAGLAVIAAVAVALSWLIKRNVLAPVARLQHGARQVAAGNWSYAFGRSGADEIGQLSRDLGSMTQALRASLQQVERSNQELAGLNKELESFSYSVSHDLRSPLRSMDGFSLALLQDYGDRLDEEGKDYLQRIRAACQRMGRLIDDLLGLARVTRVELRATDVDVSALAREIADAIQGQDGARSVRWRIDENMKVRADRDLMRIALQNLLDNAWKFTGKTEMATIHVGAAMQGPRQMLFVADNGAGFDMAYAGKLFGAFQRMHRMDEFPGTGIGLAIVNRIVQRHGGRIWAASKVGAGATFHFTIGASGHDDLGQNDSAG